MNAAPCPGADAPVALMGSSSPTGTPPRFAPVATAASAAPAPDRAAALALIARHRAAAAAITDDAADDDPAVVALDASVDALMAAAGALAISPSRDVVALGTKAEVALALAAPNREDYETLVLGHEPLIRSILEDARRLGAGTAAPHQAAPRRSDGRFRAALLALTDARCAEERADEALSAIGREILASGVPDELLEHPADMEELVGVGPWSSIAPGRTWLGHVDCIAKLRRRSPMPARAQDVLAAHDRWAVPERMAAWSAAWDASMRASLAECDATSALLEVRVTSFEQVLAKVALDLNDRLDPLTPLAAVDRRIDDAVQREERPPLADVVLRDVLGMLVARDATCAQLADEALRGAPAEPQERAA